MQLRYALVFFFLTWIGSALVQFVSYLTISRVLRRILNAAGETTAALEPVIDVAIRVELLRAMWLLPLLGIGALIVTALVLHRFVGPVVPLTRHIRQLIDGDYDAHTTLRVKDEMFDLADALNTLSETLRSRQAGASGESPLRATGTEGIAPV